LPCYLNINTITMSPTWYSNTTLLCLEQCGCRLHSLLIAIKSDILLPAKRPIRVFRKGEIRWEPPEMSRSEATFCIILHEQSDQDIRRSGTRKFITQQRQLTLSWLTTVQCVLIFYFSKFIMSFNNVLIKHVIHETSMTVWILLTNVKRQGISHVMILHLRVISPYCFSHRDRWKQQLLMLPSSWFSPNSC
jgi:hypothetical protein